MYSIYIYSQQATNTLGSWYDTIWLYKSRNQQDQQAHSITSHSHSTCRSDSRMSWFIWSFSSLNFSTSRSSARARGSWLLGPERRHPHHLGQHQTHHFRQHPEITHSSHFGRSLWATRISSLWATRKTSFLSSHYLTQPFGVWLGGWGGQKSHWCWEQGWDPWT